MDSFFIRPYEILETQNIAQPKDGFNLVYLPEEEWDQTETILKSEFDQIDFGVHEVISEAHHPLCNGELSVLPQFNHLKPGIHHLCLRDVDEEGKEVELHFILTPHSFIFLKYTEGIKSMVTRWAQRGALSSPLTLANLLALDLLFHYQIFLDKIESNLLELEKDILVGPDPVHQKRILSHYQKVTIIKKSVSLHQTAFTRLGDLVNTDDNREEELYQELREKLDRFMDMVQNTQGMIESLRDAYQTAVQNTTNDITKLLTIFATIFLPISLLTGFFGMNFVNLPLIKTTYGLWVYSVSSLLIVVIAFFYFRHKKWLRFWHKRH